MEIIGIILGVIAVLGFVFLNKLKDIFKKKPKKKKVKTSKEIKFTGLAFDFYNLINVRRLSIDTPTVKGNDILTKFAKEHCIYMVEKGRANHDNSLKRHDDIRDYGFGSVSEIASTWYGNKRMFEAYLRSQKHRKKIEDKRYTDAGIHIERVEVINENNEVKEKLFNVTIFANKKNLTKI